MRTVIFEILLMIIFAYNSSAQDFAPVGAKWHFGEGYAWSNSVGFITYESIGDTIINNLPCRTLYKSTTTCCIPGGIHFLHQSADSIFHFNPETETFNLIIKFDAEVGDSWILHTNPDGNLMSDSATCIVDSISYFHYSPTDSLKIMNVRLVSFAYNIIFGDTLYYTLTNQIIEKAGFRNALLPGDCIYYCDVNFEDDIRCYEDFNVGLIAFSGIACEYTPVEDITIKDEITVYPNPARDKIYIEAPDIKSGNIKLFSAGGTQIFVPIHNNELDINTLTTGIYYLKIQTENGVISKTITVLK